MNVIKLATLVLLEWNSFAHNQIFPNDVSWTISHYTDGKSLAHLSATSRGLHDFITSNIDKRRTQIIMENIEHIKSFAKDLNILYDPSASSQFILDQWLYGFDSILYYLWYCTLVDDANDLKNKEELLLNVTNVKINKDRMRFMRSTIITTLELIKQQREKKPGIYARYPPTRLANESQKELFYDLDKLRQTNEEMAYFYGNLHHRNRLQARDFVVLVTEMKRCMAAIAHNIKYPVMRKFTWRYGKGYPNFGKMVLPQIQRNDEAFPEVAMLNEIVSDLMNKFSHKGICLMHCTINGTVRKWTF